jgi:hypothetical protein
MECCRQKVRATGFEPATVGFGVQRSTVGATPSQVILSPLPSASSELSLIIFCYNLHSLHHLHP